MHIIYLDTELPICEAPWRLYRLETAIKINAPLSEGSTQTCLLCRRTLDDVYHLLDQTHTINKKVDINLKGRVLEEKFKKELRRAASFVPPANFIPPTMALASLPSTSGNEPEPVSHNWYIEPRTERSEDGKSFFTKSGKVRWTTTEKLVFAFGILALMLILFMGIALYPFDGWVS